MTISNQPTDESQLKPDVFEAIRCHFPNHCFLGLKEKPLQYVNHHLIPNPFVEEIRDNGLKAGLPYSFNVYYEMKALEEQFQSGQGIPDISRELFKQNSQREYPKTP